MANAVPRSSAAQRTGETKVNRMEPHPTQDPDGVCARNSRSPEWKSPVSSWVRLTCKRGHERAQLFGQLPARPMHRARDTPDTQACLGFLAQAGCRTLRAS